MPVLIPERTIDSLFAFEFLTVAPTATIWSPHNNRGAGTVDHEIRTSRRYFEVECKTIYRDDTSSPWYIKVRMPQLHSYLAVGKRKLIYLLPAQPVDPQQPWRRTCSTDPNLSGHCRACDQTRPSTGPVFYRRRAYLEPHVQHATPEVRMQPWFNHWAWCISAENLDRYIAANPRFVHGDYAHIPADDPYLEAVSGTERLCHLFEAVDLDFATHDPFGNRSRVFGQSDRPLNDVALDAWTMPPLNDDMSAIFVPALDEVHEDEQRILAWY